MPHSAIRRCFFHRRAGTIRQLPESVGILYCNALLLTRVQTQLDERPMLERGMRVQ